MQTPFVATASDPAYLVLTATFDAGDDAFSPLPASADLPAISVLPGLAATPPFLGLGIRYAPLSGDPRIDGLLYDGRAWAGSFITYGFPDTPDDYEFPYGAFNEPWLAGFGQVSAVQMQAIAAILEGGIGSIEVYTLLDFAPGGDTADLRIAQSEFPLAPAWTYLPADQPYGGDVWFVTGVPGYDFRSPVLGSYYHFAHLHELVHAIGLKDGQQVGPGTPALPSDWDSLEFTVATYRSFIGAPTDGYRNELYGFPQSHMMLDIAALQYLYGADFGAQAGDTVYRWDPLTGEMSVNGVGQGAPGLNRVFLTIWDGDGIDTYDMGNYPGPVSIDLTPGGWSVTSEAQKAVLGQDEVHVLARGNVFNALQYQGDPRSLIEHATGGNGSDLLHGNAAANALSGGAGDDTLDGAAGADTMEGGEGDDAFTGGAGADSVDGGAGFDVLDYRAEATQGGTQGISVNLLTFGPTIGAFISDSFGTFDVVIGVEGVIGTDLGDFIYGSNDANLFRGLGSADQIVAWGGADTIDGGDGDDVMLGWTGDDSLAGGAGNDWAWAGDGSDTATGDDGVDVLVGDLPGSAETGNDLLTGGLGEDILLGGAGADTLIGGADTTAGSDPGARDWLVGGAGNDLVFGGSGDDVIWEQLDFSESGADSAAGGDGNDLILTGSGADSIDAGAGNDTIYGGAGADTIAGGAGSDWSWITGTADLGDVLLGFAPGQDKLVVYPLLGGLTTAQAFAQAVLLLVAAGPDTELRFDADGAGGAASVLAARFLGLAPGALNTATDFI